MALPSDPQDTTTQDVNQQPEGPPAPVDQQTPPAAEQQVQAPEVTWDQLSNSDEFKQAKPEDQQTILANYANHTRQYLQSLGGDTASIDSGIHGFLDDESKKLSDQHFAQTNSGDLLGRFLSQVGVRGVEATQGGLHLLQGLTGETNAEATSRLDKQISDTQDQIKSEAASGQPTPTSGPAPVEGEEPQTSAEQKLKALQDERDNVSKNISVSDDSNILAKRKATQSAIDSLEAVKTKIFASNQVDPQAPKKLADHVADAAASVFDMTTGGKVMISKMALSTFNGAVEQSLKENGGDIHQASQDGAAAVVKMAPLLLAYAAGGKLAVKASDMLLPEAAGTISRFAVGAGASTAANMAASAVGRVASGGKLVGDTGANLTDAAFGVLGATHVMGEVRDARIERAHQKFQDTQDKADNLDQSGMPSSATALRDQGRADFHQDLSNAHGLFREQAQKLDEIAAKKAEVASTSGPEVVGPTHPAQPGLEGQEHIVSTAIKDPESDRVVTGPEWNSAHADITRPAVEAGIIPEEKDYGFMVDDGQGNQRFVGRKEAGEIAKRAGQAEPSASENFQSQELKKEPAPMLDFKHYSNEPDLTELNPDKYGSGASKAGGGDEFKRSKSHSEFVNRSFVGLKDYVKEADILPHYEYTGKVASNQLYDINADPLGLAAKAKEVASTDYSPNDKGAIRTITEKLVKDKGYLGYHDSTSGAAALFHSTPVERVKFSRPDAEVLRKIATPEKYPDHFGETFDEDGKVHKATTGDVVTLTGENVPLSELTPERVQAFRERYSDVPNTHIGVYRFEDGKRASIDLNVIADKDHHENTIKFARDNQQESIYSYDKGDLVKTGGSGESVLSNPDQFKEAAAKLKAGKPVNISELKTEGGETNGNSETRQSGNQAEAREEKQGLQVTESGGGEAEPAASAKEPALKREADQPPLGTEGIDEDTAHTGRTATSEQEFQEESRRQAEGAASETPPADAEGEAPSAIPSSEIAWRKSTFKGVDDLLKSKGVDPDSVGWTQDAADRVARTVNKAARVFDKNPQEFTDKAKNRVRDQLLRNVEETGNPLKVRLQDGTEKEYNPYLTARSEISNQHEKIGARETGGVPAEVATEKALAEGANPAELAAQKEVTGVRGEHPFAKVVRAAITRHFNDFAKATDIPLDAAPDASPAQVLRAAHIVYDELLQKSTGHPLGIGESFSKAGKPGPVQALIADPAFRASVEDRIAGRIRQDIRAGVPKDRAPLKQAEKILSGETGHPVFGGSKGERLDAVKKFLMNFAKQKENEVIPRRIDLNTSKGKAAAVEAIASHTMAELRAWKQIAKDYTPFYSTDILERTNPKLQEWAQKKYGRPLTEPEVALFHLVSAFGSPRTTPSFDSLIGTRVLDEYIRTGKATGFTDKPAQVWAKVPGNVDKKPVFIDAKTGADTFEKNGNQPKYKEGATSQVSRTYDTSGLQKLQVVMDHFGNDLGKAMNWLGTTHSYDEFRQVLGDKIAKGIKPHEYFDRNGQSFGVFGLGGPTGGAKVGSYILNRWQHFGTITKDLWLARTMARYFREPESLDGPWNLTKDGVNKRRILDEAWGQVADKLQVTPAQVQEMMWDAEKTLYGKLGSGEPGEYTSQGVEKAIGQILPKKESGSAEDNTEAVGSEDQAGTGVPEKSLAQIDLGFQQDLDKPALQQASDQINAGTPMHQVVNSLPQHLREQTRSVMDRYRLREGSQFAMKSIEVTAPDTAEGRMQKALAEAYSKIGDNHPVIADPTLQIRRGAAGEFMMQSGRIFVDPRLPESGIREALLHEQGHGILSGKTQSYISGDLHLLSDSDIQSFGHLDQARSEATAELAARGMKPHVGLSNLHEFVQYAVTNGDFQELLDGIKSTTPEGRPTTLLRKVLDLFKRLAVGGKGVVQGSVLDRALEHSFNLIESGRQEDQLALKYGQGEEPLKQAADLQDQKRQAAFLNDSAKEHGFEDATDMAVNNPAMFNSLADGYRKHGVASTPVEEPSLRQVASDPKVISDTEKRAKGLFDLIDEKKWSATPASEIVSKAMEDGASNAEDFAQAFEKAGLTSEAAQAAGEVVKTHFDIAGMEKAQEIREATDKDAQARQDKEVQPVTPEEGPQTDGGPEVTSIKNAVVDREREDRGLPSAMQPARKEFGDTWDQALNRIDQDPKWTENLVDELKNKARPLTDEENAGLLHRQITLQNDYAEANAALIKSTEEGDLDHYEEQRAKVAQLSDDLLDLYNAGKAAGTENARGLVTRKMLANEDYSLTNMLVQKRASLGGRELNTEEHAEITRLHKKIFDLQQKLLAKADKVDAERSEKEGQAAVKVIGERVKRTPGERTPGERNLDAERQSITAGARKAFEKSKDTHDLQKYAQKLAENYIRRGITKLQTVSRAVHEVMKTIVPEITERQVRDMISGYGDFKELNKDEVKVQLRDLKGKLQQAGKLDDMLQEFRAPAKTGLERRTPGDHERRLVKLVNEAKKDGNLQVTDPARQLKTALDGIKTRLKNQIKDLSFRIETGAKKAVKGAIEPDAEIEKLRALRDRVQSTLTDIEGKPEMTDEQRVEIAKKSLEKQIADYDERLKSDDFSKKEGVKTPETPELEALRARRDAIKAEYQELEAIAHPERKMERAVAGWRTRTANSLASYQERLAAGDFSARPRPEPLKLVDPADEAAKADLERAKQEFDLGKRKDFLANRSGPQKAADALTKWGRAAKLTAFSTLFKLTAAAAHRVATTPIEEAIGGVLGHLPGVREVAAAAPSEGGFNIKAESKSIAEGLTTGMKDAWDTLQKGESNLTMAHAKRLNLPQTWVDFFGTIHGAMKAPVKRAAFTRSLEKRIAFEMKNGGDPTDPAVQTRLMMEAYKDSNRAIFLQDNRVVSAYKRAISALEERNKATGKTSGPAVALSTASKVLVPIVKVPTNYVAEAFTHAFGTISGSYKLARALGEGIEKLHPEEADQIMRHLKKGSIGAAAMLLGFFNPAPNVIQAGGYYQPGEKRQKGDVEAGGLRVFGFNVPKVLAHTPLLEVLQIGATARRVMDAALKKNHGENKAVALSSGALAGGLGLAEETPFLGAMFDLHKLKDSPGSYFGDLAKGIAVPGAINNLATWTDWQNGKMVKRKPKTFGQRIMTGIPGLRQMVPKAPDQG